MTRLIERYRAKITEQVRRVPPGVAVSFVEQAAADMSLELALIGSRIAEKYLFTRSANLFHREMLDQRLRQTARQDVSWKLKFPSLPVWIEGEGSTISTGSMEAQGFFLSNHYHPEVIRRATAPMLREESFRAMMLAQQEWYCDIVGTDGMPVFSLVIDGEGNPGAGSGHVCPWKSCRFPRLCEQCQAHVLFWGMWAVIALLIIEGNFATAPDLEAYPTVVETIKKRVGNSGNPKKKKYATEELRYHIVTFDACLKKLARPGVSESEGRESRGSWLSQAQEIDPDSVIYLDRHIAPFSRELRSPRFVHKQGQTVTTSAHEKRIPVKVKELAQKIKRVVASGYEQEQS
jgi:hypothetical protein